MGVQVSMPEVKQKQDNTSALLGLAGTIGGAVLGGPVGAAVGGTVGAEAGKGAAAPQAAGTAPIQTGGSEAQNATTRRLQELQNQKDLTSALNVAQKDPNMSKEYAPVLQNALERARMYGR